MIWQETRQSVRRLRQTPFATATAILSVALSIGGARAIFAIVNALMLRSLPAPHPQELVSLFSTLPGDPEKDGPLPLRVVSEPKQQDPFQGIFAWEDDPLRNIEAGGRVAVLDYRTWQERFEADAAMVGRTIRVDNIPLTIIGVTSKDFRHPAMDHVPDAVVPIGFDGAASAKRWFKVLARLEPGVSMNQAAARLTASRGTTSAVPVAPVAREFGVERLFPASGAVLAISPDPAPARNLCSAYGLCQSCRMAARAEC
jgi:hypothetical protein